MSAPRTSAGPSFLIVKLAAAGDVLLATGLARALRRAYPESRIGWLTSSYAAPLLEGNPDVDAVLSLPAAAGAAAQARAAGAAWAQLRGWRRAAARAADAPRALLAHRSRRLAWLLRAAGYRRVAHFPRGAEFDPGRHRLEWLAELLRAAGLAPAANVELRPRLQLSLAERALGERVWNASPVWTPASAPRWAIAPGGASNPWAAMPTRRWAAENFAELGHRARATGIAVRWLGGADDAALAQAIAARLPMGTADNYAGRLSLRHTAAVIASSDLVIGNDSLALVMAQALERPGLGLYGPTPGAAIHAPGQLFVQGRAGCGPCYDPRQGVRGRAYACPRAQCMERIAVDEVWRLARRAAPLREAAHG